MVDQDDRLTDVFKRITGAERIRFVADYDLDGKPQFKDGFKRGNGYFAFSNEKGQDVHVPFERVRNELKADGLTLDDAGRVVRIDGQAEPRGKPR